MHIDKAVLAFFISPAVGAMIFALQVGAMDGGLPRLGLLLMAARLAYGATAVVGVPLYLISRPWHPRSKLFYVSAAIATAAIPVVAVELFARDLVLALMSTVGAVAAGLTFWFLVEREPRSLVERIRKR